MGHQYLFAVTAVTGLFAAAALPLVVVVSDQTLPPASVLGLLPIIGAKVFGAACFAYAGPRWVRAGGLLTTLACAAVTLIPVSRACAAVADSRGLLLPPLLDHQFGLAPGTGAMAFGVSAALAFESMGIFGLYVGGPHGLRSEVAK